MNILYWEHALAYPQPQFRICGGPKAFASATIFMICDVINIYIVHHVSYDCGWGYVMACSLYDIFYLTNPVFVPVKCH